MNTAAQVQSPCDGVAFVRVARGGNVPGIAASRTPLFALCWLLLSTIAPSGAPAIGAEVMPPAPVRYFNDYAKVVPAQAADRMNRQLESFEKESSIQVVVAVFPKMESLSSIEDYVHRMFEAWKIGQRGKNNGVLLAVFVDDRKLRIEVGYGLEGALPDALGRRIIDNEIAPHFKRGNYQAGLAAGINAILTATKGEYKGTGRTQGRKPATGFWLLDKVVFNSWFPWHIIFGLTVLSMIWRRIFGTRGTVYDRRGRRQYSGGWGGGGGGWSSGGGFSGGGGRSGGGGASGSW